MLLNLPAQVPPSSLQFRLEGEFLVKKVMSWEGVRFEVSVTLQSTSREPNSLLTPSQIQMFWLKIHPQDSQVFTKYVYDMQSWANNCLSEPNKHDLYSPIYKSGLFKVRILLKSKIDYYWILPKLWFGVLMVRANHSFCVILKNVMQPTELFHH